MELDSRYPRAKSSTPELPDPLLRETYPPTYETVATLPLQSGRGSLTHFDSLAPLPIPHTTSAEDRNINRLTQPTQPLRTSSPDLPTSPAPIVQVAASSPMVATSRQQSGVLASAMAPAGTAFRRPYVAPPPRQNPITIDSDDEGPTYKGGSSDSDRANSKKYDIKTSSFARRRADGQDKVPESPQASAGPKNFREITANAFYRPATTTFREDPRIRDPSKAGSRFATAFSGVKRSSDSMANAYGGTPSKRPRQIGPARAQPVVINTEPELSLDDIADPNLRRMTNRMSALLTQETIRSCYDALVLKRGNFDDASDFLLLSPEEKKTAYRSAPINKSHIDLTGSEDELSKTPAQIKAGNRATNDSRQQPKKPAKTIVEKWSSTQVPKQPVPKQLHHFEEPPKKGRKLIRGRKVASSPIPESMNPATKVLHRLHTDDSDNSEEGDSGIQSASEDDSFEKRLLAFFNSCSPNDLSDTAATSLELSKHIISKRPFKSLDDVARIEALNAKTGKTNRRPLPIGDKIVGKCYDMLVSYEAVDYLVKKCEGIAVPLAEEMKSWGVNVHGSKDGELDIVSLKESSGSGHDSGIGTPVSDPGEDKLISSYKSNVKYIGQPTTMGEGIVMKDYQVVGINWLALLYRKRLSCILADDMGLGKTCQVIAFMAWLLENGEKGPHLVVVPAATLENWLQEFQRFCPTLNVEPYYASNPTERLEIAARLEAARNDINVVVTTYTVAKAKDDFPWLKHFGFCCTVFDEGHVLKNADSQVARKLVKIDSKFRLLLTGTPLQNNLKELISLLAFLMPSMFQAKKNELQSIFTHNVKAMDANHEALLSAQRIARARSMLTPFILRRKKDQVLKDLPKKERRVEYCEMTPEQQSIYNDYFEKAHDIRARRANGENVSAESTNILMRLRQAAIHPLLFRRFYPNEELPVIAKQCLRDPEWVHSNPSLIVEELQAYSDMEIHKLCDGRAVLQRFALNNNEWLSSGKVQKLLELLRKFMSEGHRTLIFSQFVMVLDILELVLEREAVAYFRLDGNTKVAERQDLIDEFCSPENETPVFMLSTKAGGAGINLAKANKVIVFDSGFNPQDDVQAENRAHRIGQAKEVEVVRLVSKGTVEEQIHAMGLTKLRLDQEVAGDGAEETGDSKEGEKKEAEGRKAVEELFFKKLEDGPAQAKVEDGSKKETMKAIKEAEREVEVCGVDDSDMVEEIKSRRKSESVEMPSRTRPVARKKPSRVKAEQT